MMCELAGRSALVTGSSHGIGREIAVSLAKVGVNLVLHGLSSGAAADQSVAECEKHGVQVQFVAADLSKSHESTLEFAAEVAACDPEVSLLVNNAGGYFDQPFLTLEPDAFERTMRLNVFSYFYLTQWFAKRWVRDKRDARVLMVGSINGRLAERAHVAYDTSKGAVEMMVRSLCVELAPHGIRINGLAPGLFHTPLTAPGLSDATEQRWMEQHTPNGVVPGPEVAGEAAVFMLSDAARHIHGHMLAVDGGMSAWQQPPAPSGW